MLTKDLVRYKIHNNNIKPQFINPNDQSLLNTATQLIELFNNSSGKSRGALLSESKIIIDNSDCNAIVTRGLEKLLLDRTTFNTDTQEELFTFRHDIFAFTSQLHNQGGTQDSDAYYQSIANQFHKTIPEIQEQLYSDLPLNQPVSMFKSLSSEALLHRYNCAQIQGLLLHCEELTLHIMNAEPACLRQLFKYLRFYQLLAQIKQLKNQSGFQIIIDGPLSLFFQTLKYGTHLALFFPAILHQNEWNLTARIQLKNRKESLQLELDQTCQIKSHYHHFMAYIPDEVTQFQNSLAQKLPLWSIQPSDRLIPLPGDAYCFPDYTLSHEIVGQIDLELFHAWHKTPLIYRLKQLEKSDHPILILGVCNKLLKEPSIANDIDHSAYFNQFGFFFKDMPTVSSIRPVLERILQNG